ncbi:MAG: hypothetical protein WCR75_12275, partial [Sphaerochaetaceae bacterium]
LVGILRVLLLDFDLECEQTLTLERRTGFLFGEREPLSGQPVSFALTNLEPPTSDPGLFYNSQLVT